VNEQTLKKKENICKYISFFKAYIFGNVTVGEIGVIKKILFSGDDIIP
jgi:hypothetical protein